jgi:hypothetical protein
MATITEFVGFGSKFTPTIAGSGSRQTTATQWLFSF